MAEREQRRRRGSSHQQEEREYDQRTIDVARVTRVMAGGKRMKFRVCVVIGDHRGKIGFGVGKGADVSLAIGKAVGRAKRNLVIVPIINSTIPHEVKKKYKAARILLKPAPKGTGVMAGGAIRSALEVSGLDNVVAKVYGSKNKINNIKALFSALSDLSISCVKHAQRVPLRVAPSPAENEAV